MILSSASSTYRSIQQLNGHESSKTLKQDEQTQLDENVVEDTGVANEDVKKRKEVSVFIGVMVRLTPGLASDSPLASHCNKH